MELGIRVETNFHPFFRITIGASQTSKWREKTEKGVNRNGSLFIEVMYKNEYIECHDNVP